MLPEITLQDAAKLLGITFHTLNGIVRRGFVPLAAKATRTGPGTDRRIGFGGLLAARLLMSLWKKKASPDIVEPIVGFFANTPMEEISMQIMLGRSILRAFGGMACMTTPDEPIRYIPDAGEIVLQFDIKAAIELLVRDMLAAGLLDAPLPAASVAGESSGVKCG